MTKEADGKIIKDENEEIIEVKMSDYVRLLKTAGGWPQFVFLQIIMIGFTICNIQTVYTIGQWTNLETKLE